MQNLNCQIELENLELTLYTGGCFGEFFLMHEKTKAWLLKDTHRGRLEDKDLLLQQSRHEGMVEDGGRSRPHSI